MSARLISHSSNIKLLTDAKDKPLANDESVEGSTKASHTLSETTRNHTCNIQLCVKHHGRGSMLTNKHRHPMAEACGQEVRQGSA
jgi:hypothetical protein